MGCLFDFFFEVITECFFELIMLCYIKLMSLIIPDKTLTEKTKKRIKNIVKTVSALLAFVLFIGVILLLQNDPFIKTIGKFMTYIPLAIIGIQIVLGIIAKIIRRH